MALQYINVESTSCYLWKKVSSSTPKLLLVVGRTHFLFFTSSVGLFDFKTTCSLASSGMSKTTLSFNARPQSSSNANPTVHVLNSRVCREPSPKKSCPLRHSLLSAQIHVLLLLGCLYILFCSDRLSFFLQPTCLLSAQLLGE